MGSSSAVVRQSAVARNGLFAFLELAFVLAFVRGVPGAATTAGRMAAATFTTAAAVAIALLWRQASRLRSWLEVADDAIVLSTAGGTAATIARRDGEELRFVMRGGFRYRHLGLEQASTDTVIMLPWYSPAPVRDACLAHGWRVDGRRPAGDDAAVPGGHQPIPENPTFADLPWLLDEGLRMVRERRQASGLDIYGSIERQLEYLKTTLERGERPEEEKVRSLTLGVYAAREFETSDPDFADVLFAVNYLANRW